MGRDNRVRPETQKQARGGMDFVRPRTLEAFLKPEVQQCPFKFSLPALESIHQLDHDLATKLMRSCCPVSPFSPVTAVLMVLNNFATLLGESQTSASVMVILSKARFGSS
jgi:hypothetical protein